MIAWHARPHQGMRQSDLLGFSQLHPRRYTVQSYTFFRDCRCFRESHADVKRMEEHSPDIRGVPGSCCSVSSGPARLRGKRSHFIPLCVHAVPLISEGRGFVHLWLPYATVVPL